MSTRDPFLRTALASCEAAAAVHLASAGRLGMEGAEAKGRSDYVSRVDREAQEAALERILERHPEHLIMAEEGDADTDAAAMLEAAGDTPVWIVDPLDGTTNFLHRHPMYCVSVAVAMGGRVVAGAVAQATTGERWYAHRGGGAWKNGRPIRVSAITRIEEALVGTGFPFKSLDVLDEYLGQLGRVLSASGGVRRGGAAALDLCHLAEGRFDAFWELFLNPWDFAAGIVIVEEAGGVVRRPSGGSVELRPGGVMGANSAAMLEALAGVVSG